MTEDCETIKAIATAVKEVLRAENPGCKFKRASSPGGVIVEVFPLAKPGFGRGNQKQPFAYEIRGPLTLGAV